MLVYVYIEVHTYTYLSVRVYTYAYVHTPLSKVIWYNLENKTFLTGLFLSTASQTYIYHLQAVYYLCKEIHPYDNLREQP